MALIGIILIIAGAISEWVYDFGTIEWVKNDNKSPLWYK